MPPIAERNENFLFQPEMAYCHVDSKLIFWWTKCQQNHFVQAKKPAHSSISEINGEQFFNGGDMPETKEG